MKTCQNCGAQVNDTALFCTKCGAKIEEGNTRTAENTANNANAQQNQNTEGAAQQNQFTNNNANTGYANQAYNNAPNYQNGPAYTAPVNPYDHTAEFTQKDISENKVIAMLVYLMGWIGIVIALLGSHNSPYASFHVRQALKFAVIEVLTGIVTLFLFWTILVPIAALIFMLVLFVVKIICFFSICKGKAVEPYIIRSFGFLR